MNVITACTTFDRDDMFLSLREKAVPETFFTRQLFKDAY